jgi:glutamate-1-semialdehyde 2,1-aminomutase
MMTADGVELIDFCGSWGPLILGHAHPEICRAVTDAASHGMSFGVSTEAEVLMAEKVSALIPSMEMVRLVSSGTEATMSALRLARGFTGRDKVLKFDGCYHGHVDCMLVAAGSGVLTSGMSSSAGVPKGMIEDVLVVPYNDLHAVQAVMDAHGPELAAIILEPVAGNMGLVPGEQSFLEGLRRLCTEYGSLLIFDEVINGFRLGPGAYSSLCGVTPDITCLGKIIGGGMPIGAFGGRREIMEKLSPLGPVYQAGTLSGNPVAVSAGLRTLELLEETNPYPLMAQRAGRLAEKMNELSEALPYDMHCASLGGMFTVFFGKGPMRCLSDVKTCDTEKFGAFFRGMLERGVYIPPSQFEVAFVSAAHSDEDIAAYLSAAEDVLPELS